MNSMISVASPLQPQVKLTKFQKAFLAFGVMMVVAFALAMFPSADGTINSIEGGINTGMKQAWDLLKAIATPIAAVVFAWNGFKMLFGGQRGMEEGKKNMLIVVAVIGIIYIAPIIITTVQGWFGDVTTTAFDGTKKP